ncbi:hypothetical protein EYD45_07245 [Hyunsoonleella flava]|uniref:Uncharacterized protein n=1 Tax=Hyunsoonleella flava TaxID=2527939 RepID=A0A4Q9FJP8_9FLAO|nr:hypothetical protein [Hyunsoonleella flava]TBN04406.1 hypothetical protein EYD45_07245 [Hyunsoonleella flava]
MNKKILFPSILALFFLATGCQDVLECVINRKPILSDNRLGTAFVNQDYFELITAEIQNEPRDNDYFYFFSVIGDLPRGIDVYFDYRDVIIEGRPLERGRYRFTIRLDVEQADNYCENNLNDCDGLCEESTARTYILTVN